jgi:hypothetical protein
MSEMCPERAHVIMMIFNGSITSKIRGVAERYQRPPKFIAFSNDSLRESHSFFTPTTAEQTYPFSFFRETKKIASGISREFQRIVALQLYIIHRS